LQHLAKSWHLQQPSPAHQASSEPSGYFDASDPTDRQSSALDVRFFASVVDVPGISATPPIAETDLEPIGPFTENDGSFPRPARPTPLDTISAQDASLPSPSLSPITAAANLAHNTNFGGSLIGDNEDDDANDVSSLDISEDRLDEKNKMLGALSHSARNKRIDLPDRIEGGNPNPQLPTPTIMDIPVMLESFDAMPEKMKT
jgi:F-box and WD-40 domain protein CDC4